MLVNGGVHSPVKSLLCSFIDYPCSVFGIVYATSVSLCKECCGTGKPYSLNDTTESS